MSKIRLKCDVCGGTFPLKEKWEQKLKEETDEK